MAGSGWSNQSVQTLTVPTGATTGARVVIGNQANGNAITVYDAGNNIIAEITQAGMIATLAANGYAARMITDQFFLQANNDESVVTLVPHAGNSDQPAHVFDIVNSLSVDAQWKMIGQSRDNTKLPTMTGPERSVTGSMVIADQVSVNNITHREVYSVTWASATATQTIPHHCSFTPVGGQATFVDGSATDMALVTLLGNYTATTADIRVRYVPGDTIPGIGDTLSFNGTFFA